MRSCFCLPLSEIKEPMFQKWLRSWSDKSATVILNCTCADNGIVTKEDGDSRTVNDCPFISQSPTFKYVMLPYCTLSYWTLGGWCQWWPGIPLSFHWKSLSMFAVMSYAVISRTSPSHATNIKLACLLPNVSQHTRTDTRTVVSGWSLFSISPHTHRQTSDTLWNFFSRVSLSNIFSCFHFF